MPPFVHLAPFSPGKDGPWDQRAVRHLLRRAGLGASKADAERAVQQGLAATVESLFADAPEQEAEFQDTFQRISGQFADFSDAAQLQAWWVYRMLRTRTPLREKLTLFWHSHFATSYNKVEELALMHQQCETLRKLAWGDFRDLVHAASRDPAMLVFLDGETNTRENPNENFGRELLELFTLGRGNYEETDVRAASRAFTGWGRDGEKFVFNADQHDAGPKEFLGEKGNFDGGEILDILVKQPATARHIARKLMVFFACPEPADDAVNEAAAALTEAHLNVKTFLRQLFSSMYFYSAACRQTHIVSPTEFVIGVCRTLGARLTAQDLRQNLADMGQELFAPPNVKGWDGEKKWINSATWAARLTFARRIAELPQQSTFGPRLDLASIVPTDLADTHRIVDLLAELIFDGELASDTRKELAEFLVTTDDGDKHDQFGQDPEFRRQQVAALLGMMLSLPEYHTW